MENKINITELLKDCPSGMELNCLMYEDVYFDYVDELNIIHCYIQRETYKTSLTFNQHGTPNSDRKSKCVIFPKGKTTWEEFEPPYEFEDGDILFVKSAYDWLLIYKESENDVDLYKYVATSYNCSHSFITYDCIPICRKKEVSEIRLATKEEKAKLFQAIKDNGYKWNHKTKTLEKLIEPIFEVGNKVRNKNNYNVVFTINSIEEDFYICGDKMAFCLNDQDDWELVPDKFDITTLKPFDKVLVRHNIDNKWCGSFFSHIDGDFHSNCYKYVTVAGKSYPMCIPYEGNEHLRGTTDDCDEYYKNW